jgi:hypothetical protein
VGGAAGAADRDGAGVPPRWASNWQRDSKARRTKACFPQSRQWRWLDGEVDDLVEETRESTGDSSVRGRAQREVGGCWLMGWDWAVQEGIGYGAG